MLSGEVVWLPGFFQGVYKPYKFLRGMRDGDIVVFAFGALLGKIGCKGWVSMANKFSSVEERIPQTSRAPFLHVRVGGCQLS